MEAEREQHADEAAFTKFVSSLTMLNREELLTLSFAQKEMWERFEEKISNFFPIFFALHIFKKYTRHTMLKYIRNGYDRLEFRAFLAQLTEYDSHGNLLKTHSEEAFLRAVDEVYEEVRRDHPNFTVGFVFFGLKFFSPQQNEELFVKICELNWDKTIGLDFVQQEDMFGPLEDYDPIVDRVLARYPHLDYKKVYHAGETKDHRTSNLEAAVKAGSVRIGHGLNVLQRIEFLPHCRNICFEKNPLSNLVLGYNSDAREASAPILLGLGYAVTINPDDPGKFGVEDSTVDYFLAAISYNWTLRHLKLIAYHSINHAICDERTRTAALHSFESRWNGWVRDFVGEEQLTGPHKWLEPDIYSNTKRWSWSEREEAATAKLEVLRNATIDSLPKDFYQGTARPTQNRSSPTCPSSGSPRSTPCSTPSPREPCTTTTSTATRTKDSYCPAYLVPPAHPHRPQPLPLPGQADLPNRNCRRGSRQPLGFLGPTEGGAAVGGGGRDLPGASDHDHPRRDAGDRWQRQEVLGAL